MIRNENSSKFSHTNGGGDNLELEMGQNYGWSRENVTALFLLAISAMYTQLDRTMMGFLLPLIKEDLGFSDFSLGLLVGPAFMAFYLFLVVPMAWLADNTSRKLVLGWGFLFFSLMAALTGAANSFWQIAAARAMVGAGESTNLGPVKSVISDMFARKHRVIALSATSASSTVSGLLMIPLIGFVAEMSGWRAAFYVAGISGAFFAVLLLLLVREPHAGASDGATGPQERISLIESLKVLTHSPAYILLAIGGALMSTFAGITISWETTFLVRIHDYTIGDAALLIGPFKSIAGLCGLVLGPFLAMRMKTDAKRALLLPVSAAGMAITESLFLLSDTEWLWRSALVASGMFLTFHTGVLFTILSMLVPPRVRGMAVAIFVLCGHFVGQMIGPAIVGLLNDVLMAEFGMEGIRYSLLLAVISALFAMIFLYAAARRVAGAVRET